MTIKKMNNYDAAKILNISGELTPEKIKAAYRAAAMDNHPDRVGDASLHVMKMINAAYDALKGFSGSVNYDKGTDYGLEVSEAIQAIVKFERLIIEVCGSWVWVDGTTGEKTDEMIEIRSALKAAGFRYHGKKNKWYTMPKSDLGRYRGKKSKSMDDIRATYGSETISTGRQKLAS